LASRTRLPSKVSGEIVEVSGQHVFVESGTHVIAESGLGVLISGQHVFVESGVHVVPESGQHVQISGQHVFVESGVYIASGIYQASGVGVTVQSGLILLSGVINATWLSGLRLLSGGSILVSGQGVIVGTATLSGLRLISGQSVTIASGTYVNLVQASGLLAVQSGEIHVMSGAVTIYLVSSEIKINNSGNPIVVGAISHGIALWSSPIISVTVKALSVNSGDIYLGGHATGQGPFSGQGFLLEPGEAINIDVDNTGKVHLFAEVSGDCAAYVGIAG